MTFEEKVSLELQCLQKLSELRGLKPTKGIDFSSNDYLGLKDHPLIRSRLIKELENGIDLCSTGSRLLRGNHHLHEEMESYLAVLFNAEAALIFNSGYQTSIGVITALCGPSDAVFSDAENHASLIDGMRLAGSKKFIFRHNDPEHLEELLRKSSEAENRFIVTESLFSMSGDLALLEDIFSLARQYGCTLIVDEAHATGLFGRTSKGCLENLKSDGLDIVTLRTFGKALGSFGAFVTCGKSIQNLLINKARSFIFTTALPPLLMIHWRAALEILTEETWRRDHVLRISSFFQKSFQGIATQTGTQIVPITVGSTAHAIYLSDALKLRGFDVRAIRFPTVARGSERLRVTFNANLTEQDVVKFKEAFSEVFHG